MAASTVAFCEEPLSCGGDHSPFGRAGGQPPSSPDSNRTPTGPRRVLLNQHAGHLVRTKLRGIDEGGVASGFAVLSSPLAVLSRHMGE